LANAAPNFPSIPITSPVDFISGPRSVSTSGNLMKGNTASLTLTWAGITSSRNPRSGSRRPTMTFAASFARGTPIALLTNGTVREARGLTSRMKISPFWTANWTFIRPTTPSSFASALACRMISRVISREIEWGGREQAESPEWTPASSMCSMTPPITTVSPSEMASTSISIASSRNLSIRTGFSSDACTASARYRRSPSSSCTISMARPPKT
jgi:hypothetical protein